MHPILKNILAIVAGIVFGSVVNGFLIHISGSIIPPPEGLDVTTYDGLKAALPFFKPENFIFPFLAHALGTLVGALVAALIAPKDKMKFALIIGFFFFLGGFANIIMLPSPWWFIVVDLLLAYFPIAYFAGRLVENQK